jgi:26S proteasome regulatory subunit N11
MERLFRLGPLGGYSLSSGPPTDSNLVDTSETVYISSLALLKMLKHGRAGVPMEVAKLIKYPYYNSYSNSRLWV